MRLPAWMRSEQPEMIRRWLRQRRAEGSKAFNFIYCGMIIEDEPETIVCAETEQISGSVGSDWSDQSDVVEGVAGPDWIETLCDDSEREVQADAVALCTEAVDEVPDQIELDTLVDIVSEEVTGEASGGLAVSELADLVGPEPPVTEYDGETLITDIRNKTGYKGVEYDPIRAPKPYRARVSLDGKTRRLGWRATAAEAAASRARYLREQRPQDHAKLKQVQEEATFDGKVIRLHVDLACSTGYKGVDLPAGRRNLAKPCRARLGSKVTIGYYATAVEAAVAYALRVLATATVVSTMHELDA